MLRGSLANPEAERLLQMARTKVRLGRSEQAVAHYDEALSLRTDFAEALFEVVALLATAHDWAGIERRCAVWIDHFPDHASHALSDRVHNLRIDALCRIGGIGLAYDTYGLTQITPGAVTLSDDEVVAIVVARNERPRLEALLEHYRRLGVGRFLFVDNGSDDGSVDLLLGEPDTLVWRTIESFRRANSGAAWVDLILRRYVQAQWCLVFDADELFIFPGYEHRDLRALCADLDDQGATCYQATTLDMYAEGRLSEAVYRPGRNPLEVFPYFDRVYYRVRVPFDGPQRNMTNYWGGVRSRIFGGDYGGYLLNKVPLFRYSRDEVLMSGQHWLARPTHEVATGRGALLHFKYTSDFADAVAEEVVRKEHAGGAAVYDQYARALADESDPVLFDPLHSVRYESSAQLVRLGVMHEGDPAARVAVTRGTVVIPEVPALAAPSRPSERPFWSVIFVLDDSTEELERVEAALRALQGAPPSELVLVSGPGTAENLARARALATDAGHSVAVAATAQHLTDVESVNLGLCHARGSWIHLLGGDAPARDFYAAMGAAVATPSAVLVVAQQAPLERALDLEFSLRTSCFVAAREAYERAGGLCAAMPLAAGWELVQRLAHADTTAPMVVPVQANHSAVSAGYGEQVVHWMAAIDLAHDIVGLSAADLAALHERCAARGADLAREDIEHGRFASALATVAETLRVPVSPSAHAQLTAALARTLR